MDVIIPTKLGTSIFTRASAANYYNSAGVLTSAGVNTLRVGYNPLNLSAAPIPILEAASTQWSMSENFLFLDNTNGLHFQSTTDYNATTAPDGRGFADKLVEKTTNNAHQYLTATGNGTVAGIWTYSVFAKAGERTAIELMSATVPGHQESWRFNLTSGTVSGAGTFTTARISNVGNGWYRCEITGEHSTDLAVVTIILVNGSGNTTYSGDGFSGVYLWGQQSEVGNVASTYITNIPSFISRSGNATYVSSSGNIVSNSSAARLSYNPNNLTLPPHLLLEPAATNLCRNSAAIGTSPWAVAGTIAVTASTTAPDSTNTAQVFSDFDPAASASYFQNITVANNSNGYVFSVYIKKTTAATVFGGIGLAFSGGTGVNTSVTINTDNGTVVKNTAAAQTPAYTKVDSHNTFWRVSIGLNNNSTGNTTLVASVYPGVNIDGSGTWVPSTSTAGTTIWWGAQVEVASTSGVGGGVVANLTRTSYIPTTTAAVTRNADVYSFASITRAPDIASTGLYYTNIPENDFPAYDNTFTYGIDVSGSNSVIYNHVKYASLQASNVGHQPDISPTWWSVIGATNAYAMVDSQVGTQTVGTVGGHIVAYMNIGAQPTISFLNMVADTVTVTIQSGGSNVYTTTIDFTGGTSGIPITDYTLTGLNTYADGILIVDIYSASKAPACGNLVVGTRYYLGSTETNPTISITDYSIKSVDAFGNPTLTVRGYAKRMNTKQLVDDSQVDFVARLMAQVRATPCVWNANTTMNNRDGNGKTSLIIYGYYKDWEIDCSYIKSYLTCQIEGLL